MRRPIFTVLVLVLVVAITACAGAAPKPTPKPTPTPAVSSPETKEIEAILVEFQRAIVARDGPAMASLFAAPDIPFRRHRVGDPKDVNVGSGADFVAFVGSATTAYEEKFWDVVITADDTLAVLDSKYSFHADGKMTNHGREIWTLARTERGWKIATVTWSVISDD
jgi:hypothetical protein